MGDNSLVGAGAGAGAGGSACLRVEIDLRSKSSLGSVVISECSSPEATTLMAT